MRTTLTIDDDVLLAAKSVAHAKSVSVGTAISELVRKGLGATVVETRNDGFPVFKVGPEAEPITLEHVKRQEDEP